MQVARYIALPFIWNAVIAYILLVTLPTAFGAKLSVILLFRPDLVWIAVISSVFAIVWGLLRTDVVISTLHQSYKQIADTHVRVYCVVQVSRSLKTEATKGDAL